MAYKEIYQRYFSKLIRCLPMDDGLFLAMLSEHELLPGDTEGKVRSLPTQTEKATYFISHVIKPSLDVDNRVYLNKLLLVMSESGYKHVEEISSRIKSEIDGNTENSKARKVMVIEKSSDSKVNDYDDYTERFTHDSDAVGAFVYLFNKLAAFFDEVEFKKFKRICTLRGADYPQDFRKQMQAAETLDDILDTLEKPNFCNWLNIRLLKRIVKLTEIPEAQSLLDAYEKCLYSKKVSEVRPYFKSIYFDPKHFTVVKAKVNKHADNLFVSDVIQFCETLESDFSFPEVIATDCDSGCFHITCVIPVQCASHAYKMARENVYKFRKFHIQYIEIESYQKLFGMSYCISKEPSDLPLSSSKGIRHIISDYYTYLEAHMDADSVSHMMHCKHLITDDDYDAITAAPNDTKMNCLLLHYVKLMDIKELFKFCDILKSIERMQGIGENLEILLKSSELKYHNASSLLMKEQKPLKMNKWTSSVEPSQVDLKFFDLMDEIILLLSAADKISFNFANKCCSLMASNTHKVPLFTESFVNKLINCKSVFLLKVLLLPFFSWFDHSILKELTSGSDSVTDLLTQFDSLINPNKPITAYPIPILSQMMIPLDDSFTIVATKSFCNFESSSLEDIMNIKATLTKHWDITDHAMQLIAICAKLNYLYWIVPQCIVSLIAHSSHNYKIQYKLWQKGITMTTILCDLYTDNLNIDTGGPFSVLSSQHEMESSLYNKLVSLEATEVVKLNTLIQENFFIQYQRLKSECKHAMAELDSTKTTLKLKVPVLENEYKTLMKKYQEIKQKNSELENSNISLQKENELLNQIKPQSQKVYKGGTMDPLSHVIKDEAYSRQVPVGMSMHKQEFKSDQAADIALKRISVDLIEELDLFNTTLYLHAMGGLTQLEMKELRNSHKTELERKHYLVTSVVPSKGQYKGMKLLMRALRQTEQYELLSLLEKTYDEEVNVSKKLEFACLNFFNFMKSEEFLQLSYDHIHALLTSDNLHVKSEQDVFDAYLNWIKHDVEGRGSYVMPLLDAIRIPYVEDDYLKDKLDNEKLIRDDMHCYQLLRNHLMGRSLYQGSHGIKPRTPKETIYVVGGRNRVKCLNSAEKYDYMKNKWVDLPSMDQVRTAVGLGSLDGRLYAVGGECEATGHEGTLYLKSVECFDPRTNCWSRIPDMQFPRSFAAVTSFNGCLYVIGGETTNHCYSSVECYNPKTNSWTLLPDMHSARSGAGSGVMDGKLYVVGGQDRFTTHYSTVECYNPIDDTWAPCTEMNYARSGVAVAVLGKYLYAIGGRNRGEQTYYNKVERYCPAEDRWEIISPLLHSRAWPAAAAFCHCIYVAGGYDGQNRLNTLEQYNPDADKWTNMAEMKENRAGCGLAVA